MGLNGSQRVPTDSAGFQQVPHRSMFSVPRFFFDKKQKNHSWKAFYISYSKYIINNKSMLFQAFQLQDTITIFNDKNTVEKHLFFLIRAYYFFIINPYLKSVVSHIRVMFSYKRIIYLLHFNLTNLYKYCIYNIAFIIGQELIDKKIRSN